MNNDLLCRVYLRSHAWIVLAGLFNRELNYTTIPERVELDKYEYARMKHMYIGFPFHRPRPQLGFFPLRYRSNNLV